MIKLSSVLSKGAIARVESSLSRVFIWSISPSFSRLSWTYSFCGNQEYLQICIWKYNTSNIPSFHNNTKKIIFFSIGNETFSIIQQCVSDRWNARTIGHGFIYPFRSEFGQRISLTVHYNQRFFFRIR